MKRFLFVKRLLILIGIFIILMPVVCSGLYYYRYAYCERMVNESIQEIVNFTSSAKIFDGLDDVRYKENLLRLKLVQEANDMYVNNAGNTYCAVFNMFMGQFNLYGDSGTDQLGFYVVGADENSSNKGKKYVDNDNYPSQVELLTSEYRDVFDSTAFVGLASDGSFSTEREDLDTGNLDSDHSGKHRVYFGNPVDQSRSPFFSELRWRQSGESYKEMNSFAIQSRINIPGFVYVYDEQTMALLSKTSVFVIVYSECPNVLASNNLTLIIFTVCYFLIGIIIVRISCKATERKNSNTCVIASDNYSKALYEALMQDIKKPFGDIQECTQNLADSNDFFTRRIADKSRELSVVLDDSSYLAEFEKGNIELDSKDMDLTPVFLKYSSLLRSSFDAKRVTTNIQSDLKSHSDAKLIDFAVKYLISGVVECIVEDSALDIKSLQEKKKKPSALIISFNTNGNENTNTGLLIAKKLMETQGYKFRMNTKDSKCDITIVGILV